MPTASVAREVARKTFMQCALGAFLDDENAANGRI